MKEQRALCWVSCVKLNSVDLWGGEGAAGDCSAPLRGGARLPSILGWGGHSGIWGWGRWGGWGDPPIDGRESSEGTEPAPDVLQWGFTFRFHCTGSAPRLHPLFIPWGPALLRDQRESIAYPQNGAFPRSIP